MKNKTQVQGEREELIKKQQKEINELRKKSEEKRAAKGKEKKVDCTRPLETGQKPPPQCNCQELDDKGKKLPAACIEENCDLPLKPGEKPPKRCFCKVREEHGMKAPLSCMVVDCDKPHEFGKKPPAACNCTDPTAEDFDPST